MEAILAGATQTKSVDPQRVLRIFGRMILKAIKFVFSFIKGFFHLLFVPTPIDEQLAEARAKARLYGTHWY